MFFALSIGDTLVEAGWVIHDWIGVGVRPAGRSFIIGTIPTWGVAIHVNDPQESAAGEALANALTLLGVEGVSIQDANAAAGHPMRHVIHIMAGDKK